MASGSFHRHTVSSGTPRRATWSHRLRGALLAGTIAGVLAVVSSCVEGGLDGGTGVEIDADDIGGVVIAWGCQNFLCEGLSKTVLASGGV